MLAASLLTASAAEASAPHRLDVGFGDPLFASSDAATREYWLGSAVGTGASLVRIGVGWSGVAPKSPPVGFDPANPASPGYDWTKLDAAVRSAVAHGLRVMFTVSSAPAWAEGPSRPAGAYRGAWKPDAAAFGAFGQALAARYSGSFPDPLQPGSTLPQVQYFETWNEPNLDNYLSPQWEGTRLVGPGLYRELLNGFYAGVKAAQPGATVIAGSLAPFGDPPGGSRTTPVEFLRNLLCLQGGRLKPIPCPQPARFDVLSDHPIAVGPPSESAESPLDVTTPDLGLLTRVLRKAEATHRVLPRGQKPLWVTEFWYDSNPPDPHGVPLYRQARWYEQDLYMFWRQGASAAITLQIQRCAPWERLRVHEPVRRLLPRWSPEALEDGVSLSVRGPAHRPRPRPCLGNRAQGRPGANPGATGRTLADADVDAGGRALTPVRGPACPAWSCAAARPTGERNEPCLETEIKKGQFLSAISGVCRTPTVNPLKKEHEVCETS